MSTGTIDSTRMGTFYIQMPVKVIDSMVRHGQVTSTSHKTVSTTTHVQFKR